MATWSTAVDDLRALLSDQSADRFCYRKKCIGMVDGTNRVFKTFEFRRETDFSTATAPEGVYVQGVIKVVDSDSPVTGEFTLHAAPALNTAVEATYYYQWFTDAELQTFLTGSSYWLGQGSTYANTPEGLRPAAINYAAQDAFDKMAMRWAERASFTFMTQDAPRKDALTISEGYRKMASDILAKAEKLRKGYYTRQDQAEAPLWANSFGNVVDPTPRR